MLKNYLLQNTLLDNSVVASVDGKISILRPNYTRHKEFVHYFFFVPIHIYQKYYHYFDIINGEVLTTENCGCENVRKCDNITIIGNILDYLTEEEMIKASDGTLTTADIIAIIIRIREAEKDKVLSLTPNN